MKKRMLLAFCLLLGVALAAFLCSTPAEAATAPNVYVAKNEAAGLMGDVDLFANSDGKLTIYLPGSAKTDRLYLSWGSSVTVKNSSGTVQTSGKVAIPAPNATISLKINGTNWTIQTVQGSADAKAMFLTVDTSLSGFYSFSTMHNSSDKSKSAAGTMAFDDTDGYYFSIKGRGNATWTSVTTKKPYNITLYKDANYDNTKGFELIDGVKAKKWSLLANYYDSSLLRNKLAYDMACKMGMGLESEYVDLWVDGEYRGNYLMTPKNDYEAPKNGYMLEIDNYTDPQSFKISGMDGRITVKDNEANVPMSEIESYMKKAWAAVKDQDSEEYLKYLDLDSWAKFYVLHEFYMSFDVMSGSLFMYREGTSSSDKLIAGPVWDMDNSMGKTQTWSGFGLSYDQQHSPLYDYIQSINSTAFWLQELGQHESFMERVSQIYNENRHVFDDAARDIDRYEDELEASAKMNYHRWGYQSGRPKISGSDSCGCVKTTEWAHYVANLRNYAVKRAAYLDDAMPETLTGTVSITGQAKEGGVLTATVTGANAKDLIYTWSCGVRTVTGGNQFVLRQTDLGKTVTCTVTAKDMKGSISATLSSVTVTLAYNGATSGNSQKVTYCYVGLTYGQLPTPAKTGYTFEGWFTGQNGTGSRVTGSTQVTKTTAHNLYANWKKVAEPTPTEPMPTEPTPTEPAPTEPTPTTPTTPTTPSTPVVTPTDPTIPEGTTAPTEPAGTEAPPTEPATQPTDGVTEPSVPTDGTTAPADPGTEPNEGTTAPTLSQLPVVGTEGQTQPKPTDAPTVEKPENPMKLWYILVPSGIILLLILFLLLRRKKKD